MAEVTIGPPGAERKINLGPFNGRKSVRVLTLISRAGEGARKVFDEWARFNADYEASNALVLSRAGAREELGPKPILDPVTDAEGRPQFDEEGFVRLEPRIVDGEVQMGPDSLAHMSEADWQASDQELRIPRPPSRRQQIGAVFPIAFEYCHRPMLELLALCSCTNDELGEAVRGGEDEGNFLLAKAEALLDEALGDQLVELLVVACEVVEEQFRPTLAQLEGRTGSPLALFGLGWLRTILDSAGSIPETQTTSSDSREPSSTDSPSPSDGESGESSTTLAGDSSSTLAPA